MSEVIEHIDAGNGDNRVVRVGDSHTPVSLKVYQDVYHQITGRTEQIRKRYSDNLLLEFGELEQLHHKIGQLCDVHHVVAANETISIFHDKERKEQFTSFERLRAYNANSTSPTVNVVLKYNFSIIPAGLPQPQEYVVTVRLTSRVALAKQMEEEAPPFMHARLFSYLNDNTAEITIEYADYVIARGFMEAFDEWIRGCKCAPKKPWLKHLRRWSYLVPDLLRILIILFVGYFSVQSIQQYFGEGTSPGLWARFAVIYSTGGVILFGLMAAAGHMIENAIDSFPLLSYLNLNRGDATLIQDFESRRRGVVWRFLGGAVTAIVLGIISAKLERFI